MPPNTPIAVVVAQVISHTPSWVWALFAAITLIGLIQLKDMKVSRLRVGLVALGMAGYSLWGTVGAFGASIAVLLTWATGMTLAVAANRWIGWPGSIAATGDGRFILSGSVVPLLAMWAIFWTRYLAKVTLVLHPEWAHGALFSLATPLVYGLLSGVFAARALRIVRFSPVQPAPALA